LLKNNNRLVFLVSAALYVHNTSFILGSMDNCTCT